MANIQNAVPDRGMRSVFLVAESDLEAADDLELVAYRQRRQIELCFKWNKHNLKNKCFLGASKNAVMTQIRVALILYLLLSYIKFTGKCRYGITEPANRPRPSFWAHHFGSGG